MCHNVSVAVIDDDPIPSISYIVATRLPIVSIKNVIEWKFGMHWECAAFTFNLRSCLRSLKFS